MDTSRAGKVQKSTCSTEHAASAAGAAVRLNGEASVFLVPSQRAKIALPPLAPGMDKLNAEENARFLHLVTACAQITTHYELFLLVQGELQFFLPHDILIAAWGDFRTQDPQFDVISGLPGVRTSRIGDSIVPLAQRLHKIWIDGGSQPIMLNKKVAELQACNNDARALLGEFPNMSLTMLHGIRNRRDGCDSLYITLRRRPFAINGAEALLDFLADPVIHQIDVADRKVAALRTAKASSSERIPSIPLSAREEHVTYWVCKGKTNGQIANILGISVNTVKNHVQRIFDKLGANNRTQAVFKYKDMAANPDSKWAGGDY